jgi:hypothetical protein
MFLSTKLLSLSNLLHIYSNISSKLNIVLTVCFVYIRVVLVDSSSVVLAASTSIVKEKENIHGFTVKKKTI